VRAARSRYALDQRAARLIPDEEKVAARDFAYVNDGTLDELDAFVGTVLAAARVTGALAGRLVLGLTVIAVLLAVFGTIHFTQPAGTSACGTRSTTARSCSGTRGTTTSTRRSSRP
jgi:hypothetical protein